MQTLLTVVGGLTIGVASANVDWKWAVVAAVGGALAWTGSPFFEDKL